MKINGNTIKPGMVLQHNGGLWVVRRVGRTASQTALTVWAASQSAMALRRSGRAGAFHTRTADRVVAENMAGRIRLIGPRGRSVIGASPPSGCSARRGWGRISFEAAVVAARANPAVRARPSPT